MVRNPEISLFLNCSFLLAQRQSLKITSIIVVIESERVLREYHLMDSSIMARTDGLCTWHLPPHGSFNLHLSLTTRRNLINVASIHTLF